MSNTLPTDRRQSPDRRNHTARRRHAEQRRLCVELCNSVLRVAIVVDSDSFDLPEVTTHTVRWRKEAKDVLSDAGQQELTAALRDLVTEERLVGCSVSFAINGTLCVNRATTGAVTAVEPQIAKLKDRSQLYLSLGPGAKTAAVGRKPIDARHEHALVTVTNEKTLALLVGAAEAAGLVVDVVESALVALSRLQGRLEPDVDSAVILAQIDARRSELAVCRAGKLLLEYRPSSDATTGELAEVLDTHHDRLTRFCSRHSGTNGGSLKRLWLIGDERDLRAAATDTGRPIQITTLPLQGVTELWRFEDGIPPSAMMGAALGLALRGRIEETGVSPNLMEEIHARAKTPLRPALLRSAMPLAAAMLLAFGLWTYNYSARTQLADLRSRVEAIRPEELRGKRLSTQIAASAQEIAQLKLLAERVERRQIEPLVRYIAGHFANEVWLRTFRLTEPNQLSVAGASLTETGLYDTVRYLEASPHLNEVALRGSGVEQTPLGPATSFNIDLELAPAMAAGGSDG